MYSSYGRIRMPELYNWHWDKPPDLVERRLRFEVPERIDARGDVLTPLDHDAAGSVIDQIASLGVESIAICLINSYVNPAHEESLARMIAERHPRISVSVSSEILREVKEYERTATTVVNAYVAPIVGRYVDSLSQSLRDLNVRAPLMIMQSNGGVMTARESSRRPVYMIESGPAAGVIAAHDLVTRQGIPNAITLDMGGTTAKASIIEDGALSTAAEYEVGSSLSLVSRLIKGGGHLIRVPAIDVAEVGAGGGSIAWLDEGQALNIGPHSAGASPGAGLLRPGWDRNDQHGRQSGPGLYQSGRPGGRRAATRSIQSRTVRRAADRRPAGHEPSRSRLWRPLACQFQHDPRRAGCFDRARDGTCGISP